MFSRTTLVDENKSSSLFKGLTEALRVYAQYAHLGYELLATVLLFLGVGYGLDTLFGTYPVWIVVMAVAGIIMGLILTIRTFNKLSN